MALDFSRNLILAKFSENKVSLRSKLEHWASHFISENGCQCTLWAVTYSFLILDTVESLLSRVPLFRLFSYLDFSLWFFLNEHSRVIVVTILSI